MGFNLLDILVAGYIAWGAWRGARRGLAHVLPGLISITVLILTGYGMYHWTGKAVVQTEHLLGRTTGLFGFVAAMVAAIVIVRLFRAKIRAWAAKQFPDPPAQKRAGAIAGGLRALIIGSTVIVFFGLLPLNPFRAPFANGSFIGRNLIRYVVPVYESLSGETKP